MSSPNFTQNQRVKVIQGHNHIIADDTVYQIGSIDRISGAVSVLLLKDGVCVGAIDQNKLRAVR